jgi:hypothetical protein
MRKSAVLFLIVILLIPSLSSGADYILRKNSFVFINQSQILRLERLKGDAFDGYINDQIKMKQMAINEADKTVTLVDSCLSCDLLPAVKVKTIDGKGGGWVFKHDLKKVVVKKKK